MADSILQALLASRYQPADTFAGMGATGVNSALSGGALVNPYDSPGQNAGMVLGAGILSALLGSWAKSSANEDNIALGKLQTEFLDPSTNAERRTALLQQESRLGPLQAAILNASFERQAKVADAVAQAKALEPLDIAKENRGFTNDILKGVVSKRADLLGAEGKFEDPITGKVEVVTDPLGLAAEKAKREALARSDAEQEALKKRYGADSSLPKALSQPEIEDAQTKLQNTFNSLPEVKAFSVVKTSADSLAKALKDKGSVSDLELVRRSIQMIEPGMAVREGEQAAVAASQSIPDSWKGNLDKALKGESSLNEDVRKGIRALAERAYNAQKAQYDLAYDFYKKEAGTKGLDPSRVSYLGSAPDSSSLFGASTGGTDLNALAELKRRGLIQ